MAEKNVEIIARGVLCVDGQLLVCRTKGAANTYLPGGHMEFGESARESLRREIEEELGVAAEVGRFLGVVEHQFVQKGTTHCEVNLVFRIECAALSPGAPPPSLEGYIEFRWVGIDELKAAMLEPAPLRELLSRWPDAPEDGSLFFGSTF